MADPVCKHEHKRLIAKDDDSQFWECLDCGEILEAGELPANSLSAASAEPPAQAPESLTSGESLSDA